MAINVWLPRRYLAPISPPACGLVPANNFLEAQQANPSAIAITSYIRVNQDGTMTGTYAEDTGGGYGSETAFDPMTWPLSDVDWHVDAPSLASPSDYEVRLTIDSGDSPTGGDLTSTWLALSSGRVWEWEATDAGDNQKLSNATLDIREIADPSGCNMTVSVEVLADTD